MSTFQQKACPPKCAKASKTSGMYISIYSNDTLATISGTSRLVWCYYGTHTRYEKLPGSQGCLKQKWTSEFWGPVGQDILLVPLNADGSRAPLFVPGSAMKNGESHTFETRVQADAMVEHMVSKKCLPKCVWPDKEEAELLLTRLQTKDDQKLKVIARDIVDKLPACRTELFLSLCTMYTKIVEHGDDIGPLLVTEIVHIGNKRGASLVNNGFEKSCVSREYLRNNLADPFFVEYISSKSGRRRRDACCELWIKKEQMQNFWLSEVSRRNVMTNWFCPINYFEHLPGIDINGMMELQLLCQGRQGRWLSLDAACSVLDNDAKHILRYNK